MGNYGGGTANVEFELLTGMSLGFLARQLSIPYQQLLPRSETFPSLVRWFADHGHDTVAIHPFSGGMYRRSEVYPRLGFDEFVDETSMSDENRDHTGTFVNDTDAFDEVLSRLREHDEPVFTHLVTMQNHYPYSGEYADPLPVDGAPADEANLIGQYARGLTLSDAALDQFLQGLRELTEPTAVVFYGDHLPGIYSGEVMRDNGELAMRRDTLLRLAQRRGQPCRAAVRGDRQPAAAVAVRRDAGSGTCLRRSAGRRPLGGSGHPAPAVPAARRLRGPR